MQDHRYTFGIEEEFFLVHPRTRNAVTRMPRALIARCRQAVGERIGHEMLQSQIETSTPICHTPAQALLALRELRRVVGSAAAEQDLAFLAAGTHPLAEWREQVHTEKPRYAQLMDDFQIVGRRNLLCGLHVHVETPPGIDRVDTMNRLMHWLPVFLALSTSSPFWGRQRTGLMSYRQAAYDEWPRTGVPDFFAGEAEYRAFVDMLIGAGAIKNAGFLWWAIRPSAAFPTLELRICDSCTRVEDAVTLASLFRCLVRATVSDPALGRERSGITRRLIDENRWRAKRYSFDDGFIDSRSGRAVAFGTALEELLELIAPHAHALDCTEVLDEVRSLLARGTSAHAQLEIYRRERNAGATRLRALSVVVDWLIATSIGDPDPAPP